MSQVVQTATTTRPPPPPFICLFLTAFCLLAFWFCDFSRFPVAFVLANRREKVPENPGVFISDVNLAWRGLVISCVDEIFWTTRNTIKPFTYFLSPSRFNRSNSWSVTVFMGCWSHSNFSGSDTTWHNFRCFFFHGRKLITGRDKGWVCSQTLFGLARLLHCSLFILENLPITI